MRAEDEAISLAWPSIGLAGLLLIGMMIWWGVYIPLDKTSSAPSIIIYLANGAMALPEPYYLIPALIIGIGCGLSSRNVVDSVIAALPGIFVIAFTAAIAIQWLAISHLDHADTDSKMAGAIIALFASTPVFIALIAIPIVFFSTSFAVLLNLIISLFNPKHRNWLVDKTKIRVPEGQLFDVGAGMILVIATAWYFLGGAINLVVAGSPTAEEIVTRLHQPVMIHDEPKPCMQMHLNRDEWALLSEEARKKLNCT
jgi:hypothetical protein